MLTAFDPPSVRPPIKTRGAGDSDGKSTTDAIGDADVEGVACVDSVPLGV